MRKSITVIGLLMFLHIYAQAQGGGLSCPVCPPSLSGVPNGYVLTVQNGKAVWLPGGSGGTNYWTQTGTTLYPTDSSKNVGIGTKTPMTTFDVEVPFGGSGLSFQVGNTPLGNNTLIVNTPDFSTYFGVQNGMVGGQSAQFNFQATGSIAFSSHDSILERSNRLICLRAPTGIFVGDGNFVDKPTFGSSKVIIASDNCYIDSGAAESAIIASNMSSDLDYSNSNKNAHTVRLSSYLNNGQMLYHQVTIGPQVIPLIADDTVLGFTLNQPQFQIGSATHSDTSKYDIFDMIANGNTRIGSNLQRPFQTVDSAMLHVYGKTQTTTLQIESGAFNDAILRSDANGNLTYQPFPSDTTVDIINSGNGSATVEMDYSISYAPTNATINATSEDAAAALPFGYKLNFVTPTALSITYIGGAPNVGTNNLSYKVTLLR